MEQAGLRPFLVYLLNDSFANNQRSGASMPAASSSTPGPRKTEYGRFLGAAENGDRRGLGAGQSSCTVDGVW